jgi:hypothetical protein
MTLARHMFLNAVAQLRKCVLGLDGFGVPVPQLQDSKLIRLLRDVDEHWEQVDQGRSLNELRQLMPDEGPGRIEYTNKYIWFGGMNTLELIHWADEVDKVVRQQMPIPTLTEPLAQFLEQRQQDQRD